MLVILHIKSLTNVYLVLDIFNFLDFGVSPETRSMGLLFFSSWELKYNGARRDMLPFVGQML